MTTSREYVAFDSGLNMNTRYLTEQVAYFLGGIYASEEQVIASGIRYKVDPVRYNYNAATEMEIAQHYELVRDIAVQVNGQTVMVENIRGTALDSGKNRMPGFATFFRSTTLIDLVDLIPSLKTALYDSPWSVKRAFLVGAFDGRSSADINKKNYSIRYLSLDCITDAAASFLSETVEMCGFDYNYNTSRERKEGGRPRNPQLRIKDVDTFMDKIGLISPRRVNLLKNAYEHTHNAVLIRDNSDVLPGLKTISVR